MKIYRASIRLPNGTTLQTHVAADFVGSALQKVRTLCSSEHFFRPYSGVRLSGRAVENADADAVRVALTNALNAGERSTARALTEALKAGLCPQNPDHVAGVYLTAAQASERLSAAFSHA